MGRLFKEFTEEKWEQVRTHDYYAKVRADIVSLAESYMKTDPHLEEIEQKYIDTLHFKENDNA